jgi:cobalamin-dependent methionine synthase I
MEYFKDLNIPNACPLVACPAARSSGEVDYKFVDRDVQGAQISQGFLVPASNAMADILALSTLLATSRTVLSAANLFAEQEKVKPIVLRRATKSRDFIQKGVASIKVMEPYPMPIKSRA